MGNKTSKSTTQSNSAPTPEEIAEVKRKLEQKDEELKKIEEELKSNPSLPTLLDLFYKMLETPNYENFRKIIKQLGSSMSKMYGVLPELVKFVGKKMVADVYLLINEFNELLILSKRTLIDVNEQAKIQQGNLEEILEEIDDMVLNGNCDKTQWVECMNMLSKWISDEALNELLNKWNKFIDDCKIQQDAWDEKLQNSSSKNKSRIKKGLLIFGAMMGVAAFVALCIFCAPAAFGLGSAAAFSGVLGTATTMKIGLLIGGGFLVTGTSCFCSCMISVETNVLANDICKKAITIRKSILEMCAFGKQMQKNLNDLENIKKTKMSKHLEILQNSQARKKIKKATLNLLKYLIDYQLEANKTILEIGNCQQDLIKRLRKL